MNPQTNISVSLFSNELSGKLNEAKNTCNQKESVALLHSPFTHVSMAIINAENKEHPGIISFICNYLQNFKLERDTEATFEKLLVVNGFDDNKKYDSRKFSGNVQEISLNGLNPPFTIFTWIKINSESYERQIGGIVSQIREKYQGMLDERFKLSLHATFGTYWGLREGEFVLNNVIKDSNLENVKVFKNPTEEDFESILEIHNSIEINHVGDITFDQIRISPKVDGKIQTPIDIPLNM